MNNSFPRLIDGMCATLRTEVLSRLDDEFARGQVFGVINLLNTFKVRADWSAGFLLQQIAAQQDALAGVSAFVQGQTTAAPPALALKTVPAPTSVNDLLALRENGNQAIVAWLNWLASNQNALEPALIQDAHALLRKAMLAEVTIELKNSSLPMFAQMSSGQEG